VIVALVVAAQCKRHTGTPGHETYVVRKPIGGKTTYVQTLHGIESTPLNVFYEVADVLDMRPQRHKEEFSVTVKGDVNIQFRAHIIIALKPDSSKEVVENYGRQFYETKIQKRFNERVRAEVTKYGAFEVKEKRKEITANVLNDMRAMFKDSPFFILDVLTGNIDYDPRVKLSAVRATVKKEESNQRDIQLKIQEKDNQIKETEAEGIRASQDLIRGSLTRQYNAWNGLRAIEELAGASEDTSGAQRPAPNTTFIFAPVSEGGQVPVILSDTIFNAARKPAAPSLRRR
jgi:hypothetical protein